MSISKLTVIAAAMVMLFAITIFGLPDQTTNTSDQPLETIDNSAYIFNNNLYMFVTNYGSLGRDFGDIFNLSNGTWYPVLDPADIPTTSAKHSPLYASGLWLAADDNRVSVAEYDSDFVPGPMAGGTFQPDNPAFRSYHLYADSMADNPNDDYLNWPVDQGAPVNPDGTPKLTGAEMIWSVYNDADPLAHDNMNGSLPLGVEVHQTIYTETSGSMPPPTKIVPAMYPEVTQLGNSEIIVEPKLVNPDDYTGQTYTVEVRTDANNQIVWDLLNVTTGTYILTNQSNISGDDNYPIVDGYLIKVYLPFDKAFKSFDVIANAGGTLPAPTSGALATDGFPTPGNGNPDETQQVGPGSWAIHTADIGPSIADYGFFVDRLLRRNPEQLNIFLKYDWEVRFKTEATGGFALKQNYLKSMQVPFELWSIGKNSPDDPSDDIRLVPYIDATEYDNYFRLVSYGPIDDNYYYYWGHRANGDFDPYTQEVSWRIPTDADGNITTNFGDTDYMTYENMVKTLPPSEWHIYTTRVIEDIVFINLDGGYEPYEFTAEIPEAGTIFRILSYSLDEPDQFTFTQTAEEAYNFSESQPELFIKYKIYNKGNNNLNNMFVGFWADPDIGYSADDRVGCDSVENIFYAYNATAVDEYYSDLLYSPVIGYKLIHGPLVPLQGARANFDGSTMVDYTNLGMTHFYDYYNGQDPTEASAAASWLQDDLKCEWYNGSYYETTNYSRSGDPVTNIGNVDHGGTDQRMIASFGPFNMNPGDSQYVLIKMATTFSPTSNYLDAITEVKRILNDKNPALPVEKLTYMDPASVYDIDLNDPEYDGFKLRIYTNEYPEPYQIDNIDLGSIMVSGSITPLSVTVVPASERIREEHLCITIAGADLVNLYPPEERKFDGIYTITATLSSGEEFELIKPFYFYSYELGDINADHQIDISDLVYFVDYSFRDGPEPPVSATADLNGDGIIDIDDLTMMVRMIFPNY